MSDDDDGDRGPGRYDNSHRALLQAFLARGVMTEDELKPVLAHILTIHGPRPTHPSDLDPPAITAYLAALSSRLAPLDLELRSQRSQHARDERHHALVNASAADAPVTAAAAAATKSADEIAFVRRVIDGMFRRNYGGKREVCAVRGNDAVNFARVPEWVRRRERAARERVENGVGETGGEGVGGKQKAVIRDITMSRAEEILNELVDSRWFARSRAGFVSLAPRALMELRDWLVDAYNPEPGEGDDDDGDVDTEPRVKHCVACREIVTVGQRCPTLPCPIRLHDICVQPFFRTQPGQAHKCPRCKTDWTTENPVGERAAQDQRRGSTRRSAARVPLSSDEGSD